MGFDKLPAGASVTQFSIGVYNETIDMLNWWRREGRRTGADPRRLFRQNHLIQVRNDSGEDFPWLGIVGLDDVLYSHTDDADGFRYKPAMKGELAITAPYLGRWGIAWEPIGNGEVGWVCVAGVTPTKMYVYEDVPGYAAVRVGATSTDRFWPVADSWGGARVLYRESGTGFKWGLIRIGDSKWERSFELKDVLTPGSNATAHPLDSDGTADTTAAREFEVYDAIHGDLRSPVGAKGFVSWLAGSAEWEITSIQRLATKCKGLVKGATVSPNDFTVDNVVVYNGLSPVAGPSSELTVKNTFSDDADDNAVITFSWNETDDQWEEDDIECRTS